MKNWVRLALLLILGGGSLALVGCLNEDPVTEYASQYLPRGTASTQSSIVQQRRIEFQLETDRPYEMAYFVDSDCQYGQVSRWLPFQSNLQIDLPSQDGEHRVSFLFRDQDHFLSSCSEVSIVLDQTAPTAPTFLELERRHGSTLATPGYSFGASQDQTSGIAGYQVRLLNGGGQTIVDWVEAVVAPAVVSRFEGVVLTEGISYTIQARSKDRAGNLSLPVSSNTFFAGPFFSVADLEYSAPGFYTVTISMSSASTEETEFSFQTADGTALAGLDYQQARGSFSIPAGQTTGMLTLVILDTDSPGERRYFDLIVQSEDAVAVDDTARVLVPRSLSEEPWQGRAPATTWRAVDFSVGDKSSCAIGVNGDVRCWGESAFIGIGGSLQDDFFDYSYGIPPIGLENIRATKMTTSDLGACIVTSSQRALCWGQLGTDFSYHSLPTDLNETGVVDISRGTAYNDSLACLTNSTGAVRCWGRNTHRVVSVAASTGDKFETPTAVDGFGEGQLIATRVAVGADFACAIVSNSSSQPIRCWGDNSFGQLGTALTAGTGVPSFGPSGIGDPVDLQVAERVACSLNSLKELWCWGRNTVGQLAQGLGTTSSSNPVQVTGAGLGGNVRSVYVGNTAVCAIRDSDGAHLCWGDNRYGGLGYPYWGVYSTPIVVADSQLGSSIQSVRPSRDNSILSQQTCSLEFPGGESGPGGLIHCMGKRFVIPTENTSFPYPAPVDSQFFGFGSEIAKLTGQAGLTCALSLTGEARCFGAVGPWVRFSSNDLNVIGPTIPDSTVLTYRDVAASQTADCLISATGQVRCRGQNDKGQLGRVNAVDSPLEWTGWQDIAVPATSVSLALGYKTACVLTSDGKVYCWGDNSRAQVKPSDQTGGFFTTPTQVTGLPSVRKLVLSEYSACAISAANELWCWGNNGYGQINGTVGVYPATPLKESRIPGGVVDVAIASGSICAISVANNLYCWGLNSNGTIGNGTQDNSTEPVQVAGLSQVKQVSLNFIGACAIAGDDGRLYCWGNNTSADVGDGASGARLSPSLVGRLRSVKQVVRSMSCDSSATCYPHTCALTEIYQRTQMWCWGSSTTGLLQPRKLYGSGEIIKFID